MVLWSMRKEEEPFLPPRIGYCMVQSKHAYQWKITFTKLANPTSGLKKCPIIKNAKYVEFDNEAS